MNRLIFSFILTILTAEFLSADQTYTYAVEENKTPTSEYEKNDKDILWSSSWWDKADKDDWREILDDGSYVNYSTGEKISSEYAQVYSCLGEELLSNPIETIASERTITCFGNKIRDVKASEGIIFERLVYTRSSKSGAKGVGVDCTCYPKNKMEEFL